MIDDQAIAIPPCMTPRPGEHVVFYRAEVRFEGHFRGYDRNDQLMITRVSGAPATISNFMHVRLAKPETRSGGCYTTLPDTASIVPASDEEKAQFKSHLDRHISPGPKFIELIEEIWSRGYEVFLVGGSTRDILNGGSPNDIDLVSTIPFFVLSSLAESMFGVDGYSRHLNNGFMSVGFNAGDRDKKQGELIDIKNFFSDAPGMDDVEFGCNIDVDHRLRDFSCNAVYYDPINHIFIDPCGNGIHDARQKTLNLVNDPTLSHPTHRKAHIVMRMIKFMHRDYEPSEECLELMRITYEPLLHGCKPGEVWNLFFRTILSKAPKHERAEYFWKSKQLMIDVGFSDVWDSHIKQHERNFRGKK